MWAPHYTGHDDRQLRDLGYPVPGISCNPELTGHLSVEGIIISIFIFISTFDVL